MVVTENLSIDGEAYSWDFGDPLSNDDSFSDFSPTYTYEEDGEYTIQLVVANSGACTDTLEIRRFVNFEDNSFIPSAFSPNGDGRNDRFRLLGSILLDHEMLIFNQWGELVFSGNDQDMGWDGTIRGELGEPGNYTYVIEGTDSSGESILYKGIISLIR
ncbi:MAG: gliding motility-associated C-terminal domain-containing protein [Flavobacteriales bacterium]|nr:gliding motility-associated C-terminal domain-containing protein [Flavobacteriales bacterium]